MNNHEIKIHTNVLDLFSCVVIDPAFQQNDIIWTDYIAEGFVTDFIPSAEQIEALKRQYKYIEGDTLFSVEERMNAPLDELLTKQFLHYVEVYGVGVPGLFNLKLDNNKIVTLNYVEGITLGDLYEKIEKLLNANAPIKDTNALKEIIQHYNFSFDLDSIQNNEMRIALFDPKKDVFSSGDDAVRYLVYLATGNTMLIKSKEVVNAILTYHYGKEINTFLRKNLIPLAQVFNRHKRLILALKKQGVETTYLVNLISRRSKTEHLPVAPSINRIFMSLATNDPNFDFAANLSKISVRDKFKLLNLIAIKRLNLEKDIFSIRNGKMWVKDRKNIPVQKLNAIERAILYSLQDDLGHLKGKNILLDPTVDYGLPVSRKQVTGRVPNGTTVTLLDNYTKISSGVYWENNWGVTDLDLSAIDEKGNRVGWGQYSGYANNDIVYSGDMTYAEDGAMEFMTSSGSHPYAIYANIYCGSTGSAAEVLVGGSKSLSSKWIDAPFFREKITLESNQTLLGFVKNNKFIAYARRHSNTRVSGVSATDQFFADFWTISGLFNELGIEFSVYKQKNVEYDYDLSYNSFSYDKLEDMIFQ